MQSIKLISTDQATRLRSRESTLSENKFCTLSDYINDVGWTIGK